MNVAVAGGTGVAGRHAVAALEVPLPGRTGRELATGGGLPGPSAILGTRTFTEWLRPPGAAPSPASPASGGAS
jgi:hypothetical protein